MCRLLPVTFRRMFKLPIYWICLIGMIVEMVHAIINNHYYKNFWDIEIALDNSLFIGNNTLSILSAVFICIFIGAEYSNKTIRNKIIVGHSKPVIYLSNVIVCSVGTLIMQFIPFIINATLGTALFGGYENPKNNIIYIVCSLFTVVAKVSVVVFFAMLITSRTFSLILVVIMIFLLERGSMMMNTALEQPKMWEDCIFNEETLEVIETIEVENPNYVDGTARDMLEFTVAFVPYAQAYRYGNPELPENIAMYPIFSLGFAAIATSGGVLIFRRKDIS